MPLRVKCPGCQEVVTVADKFRGEKVRCNACGKMLAIPGDKSVDGSGGSPAGPSRTKPPAVDRVEEVQERAPSRMPSSRQRRETEDDYDDRDDDRDEPRRRSASRREEEDDDRPARRSSKSRKGSNASLVWGLVGGGVVLTAIIAVVLFFVLRGPTDNQPLAQGNPQANNPNVQGPIQGQPGEQPPVKIIDGTPPAEMSPETVVKVKQSTVHIKVEHPSKEIGSSEGSGFFAHEPGIIFTNAHVLGLIRDDGLKPTKIEVVVNSGTKDEASLTATIIGVDRKNDLAVLRVNGDVARLPSPLPLASAEYLIELQKVYVFGFPFGSALGKSITVSNSSVSSLRKDAEGAMNQIQVNGGMHPGNSGGPVVDTRGSVVGIAVAIISGTQINFAIPSDLAQSMIQGRHLDTFLGEPYRDQGQVKLPIEVAFLDPVQRIGSVKLEYWVGNAGSPRPATLQKPAALAGDGPKLTMPALYAQGVGKAELVIPSLGPNQVLWIQPAAVSARSAWAPATSYVASNLPPLERTPAQLQQKLAQAPIRTIDLKGTETLTIIKGAEKLVITEKLKAGALESLSLVEKGTKVALTMGPLDYTQIANGKDAAPNPNDISLARKYPPGFLTDATGHIHTRQNPGAVKKIAGDWQDLYYTLSNDYEISAVPIPSKLVQPLEEWTAKQTLLVKRDGKPDYQDVLLVCTYEGLRSLPDRKEAFIRLAGEVKGKSGIKKGKFLGNVKGFAIFDLDKGFVSQAKITVGTDLGVGLLQLSSRLEIDLTRTVGNALNLVAAADPPVNPKPMSKTTTNPPAKTKRIVNSAVALTDADKKDSKECYFRSTAMTLKVNYQYTFELTVTGGNFVPNVFVVDKANQKLAEDSNAGAAKTARITLTVPATGTYFVVSRNSRAGELGQYTLKMTEEPK